MMDRLESFDTSDLMEFITPPKIKLIGSGGAGNNILNRIYSTRIEGVETIALNTDANHLNQCKAHSRKVLGAKLHRAEELVVIHTWALVVLEMMKTL